MVFISKTFSNLTSDLVMRKRPAEFIFLEKLFKKYEELRVYNPYGNSTGPWRIIGEGSQFIQKEVLRKKTSLEFVLGQFIIFFLWLYLLFNLTSELDKNKLDLLFSECCISLRFPPRWNKPR